MTDEGVRNLTSISVDDNQSVNNKALGKFSWYTKDRMVIPAQCDMHVDINVPKGIRKYAGLVMKFSKDDTDDLDMQQMVSIPHQVHKINDEVPLRVINIFPYEMVIEKNSYIGDLQVLLPDEWISMSKFNDTSNSQKYCRQENDSISYQDIPEVECEERIKKLKEGIPG